MHITTMMRRTNDNEYIPVRVLPTYGVYVDSTEHGSTAPPLKVVVIIMLITFPAL